MSLLMLIAGPMLAGLKPVLRLISFRRLRRDNEGTTAIEFAMVATPFLMFVFALIGCSIYFFTMSSVEKGMDQASRLVRTGEAVTEKLTVAQFRDAICDGAGVWINCSKLRMYAQSFDNWADVVGGATYSCTSQAPPEAMEDTKPIALYTGSASQIVVVTTCYEWDLPSKLPFLKLGNSTDGSMMMQTATTFRSEPYPDN